MATLDLEREQQLLKLFPEPVKLHLLYKMTESENMTFDPTGRHIVLIFLSTGTVRGVYVSGPRSNPHGLLDGLLGMTVIDRAFLFDVTTTDVTTFEKGDNSKVIFQWNSISFGQSLQLCPTSTSGLGRKHQWTVKFSSDEVFTTGWAKETYSTADAKLTEVEVYRVRNIGDVLPYPWREMTWVERTRDDLRERFLSHVVAGECGSSARVLLLGPTGAGKSSFINSIRSVMFKRITHMALTGPQAPNRFKKLRSCSIQSERGGDATSLTMCDVMALGEEKGTGSTFSDALAIVKGHVPEGYKFQADKPITSETPGYRAAPAIADKIHAVLFALDARKVSSYSSHLQETMRKLQAEISDLDVPQLVLLTHVDQVCHAVQEDLRFVYRSRPVKDKMHQAAQFLDMPVSYVLPVKNYASEHSTSCPTDILLLRAVDTVLQAIDDTLDYQCANTSTTSTSCIDIPVPPPLRLEPSVYYHQYQ